MPTAYTFEDMARDYADLVKTEFGGRVDLMIGVSGGGMIGQFIAANHPDAFDHFVILVAGCRINPDAPEMDLAFARALAEKRYFRAGFQIAPMLYAESRFPLLASLIGGLLFFALADRRRHEHLATDVIVEAEAEFSFDARDALRRVTVPILIIGGAKDFYFDEGILRETHELAQGSSLVIYPKKGHVDAASSGRIVSDVLQFISSDPD